MFRLQCPFVSLDPPKLLIASLYRHGVPKLFILSQNDGAGLVCVSRAFCTEIFTMVRFFRLGVGGVGCRGFGAFSQVFKVAEFIIVSV